jgi:predicted nucleic-acid-binding protein
VNKYFADTNLFLRYLTDDVPDQAQAVEQLLDLAEKEEIELHTSVLTIAEIVWTLESYYDLKADDVRMKVIGILNTPGLNVENEAIIVRALEIYVHQNIDFVDAYNGEWMKEQGLSSAVTFDEKHFKRIPGIETISPDDMSL